jgi:hypothetical protein
LVLYQTIFLQLSSSACVDLATLVAHLASARSCFRLELTIESSDETEAI